ncbi:MAG TPA: histidine kinase [Epulopiscium sp.]|nr:histidine kinase [Candidatus Epulonipiscium sp.]
MGKNNWKNMKHRLKSIRFLMIICFSMITTVTMTITGLSLYNKFNSLAETYASESVEQLTAQVQYNLNTYTKNMITISNTLYYKIIKTQNISNNTFATQMSTIQTTNSDIAGLVIFNKDGELIAAGRQNRLKDNTNVSQQEWFKSALAKPENVHFSSPHVQNLFENQSPWVISLSTAVSLNQDGNIIQGVLVVDMNLKAIEDICRPIVEGNIGEVSIITPEGNLIYGHAEFMDTEIEDFIDRQDSIQIKKIGKAKKIVTLKTAGYTGWKIIGTWNLDKILFNFGELQTFLFVVIFIGTILCMVATLYISSLLSSPLYKLQKSMKLVEEGMFDVQIDEGGEYIVSELSKTFNKMVTRIKRLMQDIVIEQDGKRKKELEALQSQINPHFLYNTLDSIIWLAENERVEDSILMTSALSRFFRIGISSGRNIITVGEEIEHIKNYLSIQNIRYKNRFDYIISVPDELLDAKTLKLILQPVIENALYHGLEYMYDRGEILIEVTAKDDVLSYTMKDNGIGMSKETCDRLFDNNIVVKSKGSGVGMKNVNERIKLYYGEQYGMEVESELEEGTTVYIKIPLQYD